MRVIIRQLTPPPERVTHTAIEAEMEARQDFNAALDEDLKPHGYTNVLEELMDSGGFDILSNGEEAWKAYERRFCPWMLRTLPEFNYENVELIKHDIGSDLQVGTDVSVQAKWKKSNFTEEDGGTWFASSIGHDRLILFAGASDDLAPNANKVVKLWEARGKRVDVCLHEWHMELLESEIEIPTSWDDPALTEPEIKVKRYTPFEYQVEDVEDILHGFLDLRLARIQHELPCRLGKTPEAWWVAEGLGAERIVFVANWQELLSQQHREWSSQWQGVEMKHYVLAAENDVIRGMAIERLSTPEDVLQVLQSDEPFMLWACTPSFRLIADAYALGDAKPLDFGVMDEFHNMTGLRTSRNTLPYNNDAVPITRRLGMSGILKKPHAKSRLKGSPLHLFHDNTDPNTGVGPNVLRTRDDEGNIIGEPGSRRRTVGWAIDNGWLSPFTTKLPEVRDKETLDLIRGRKLVKTDGSLYNLDLGCEDMKTIGAAVMVLKPFATDEEQRWLFGLNWQSSGEGMARLLPQVADAMGIDCPEIYQIYDYTKNRDKVKRDFIDAERAVMFQVNCISEGVTLKSTKGQTITGVGLLEPRLSNIRIVQILMRAMVALGGDTDNDHVAEWMLPIFYGATEDWEDFVEDDMHQMAFEAIAVMSTPDGILEEYINDIRSGKRKWKLRDKPDTPEPVDWPEDMPESAMDMVMTEIDRQHTAMYHVSQEAQFIEGRERVVQFVKREGHSRIPRGYQTQDGFYLGEWAHTQRTTFAKGQLLPERIKSLNDIVGWEWTTGNWWQDEHFDEGCTHLDEFIASFGHAKVSKKYIVPDGYKLGSWVHSRRQTFKKGKMPQSQIDYLKSQPGWVWSTRRDPTKKEVLGIDQRIRDGERHQDIANKYGFHINTIHHIATGKTWSDVTGRIPFDPAILTKEQVLEIDLRLRNGEKDSDLAQQYGVDRKTINDIKTGRTWSDVTGRVYVPIDRTLIKNILTKEQILEIDQRLRDGEKGNPTAKAYGVSSATITGIKTGKSWSELTGRIYVPKQRLTKAQVLEIDQRDENTDDLAKEYGVSSATIQRIKSGQGWSHITGRVYVPEHKKAPNHLPWEQVLEIDQKLQDGAKGNHLAEEYSVGQTTITRIKQRKGRYAHLS
jgi:hypothetical protein